VGLSAIEEWVAEASRRYNRAPLVLDPWQAIALAQRLRYRGMTVVEFAFSSQSVGRLAVTLHTLIRDHLLALPDDPDLIDELANVRLREVSPGVLRIDHDADQHDDRAIALALAAQRLVERAPRPVGRLAMSGGRRVPGSGWRMSGSGGGWHVGGSG
jgi:phage terminase large subunit-like protein